MPKVRYSNKAVEDLSSIWEYTFSEWSESQADEYYEMLISACNRFYIHLSSLIGHMMRLRVAFWESKQDIIWYFTRLWTMTMLWLSVSYTRRWT